MYTSLNISIFLPRASNSLYISVTIDFQIAISWYVLYTISLSAQVYDHIQSCIFLLHIKSYVPYCSVKSPHKELFPLLQYYPCTYRVVAYSPHKELCPPITDVSLQIQSYPPLTVGHNVNLNKLQAVLIVL